MSILILSTRPDFRCTADENGNHPRATSIVAVADDESEAAEKVEQFVLNVAGGEVEFHFVEAKRVTAVVDVVVD